MSEDKDRESIRQKSVTWAEEAAERLIKSLHGEEYYEPIGVTEVLVLPEEIYDIVHGHLNIIKGILAMSYVCHQASSSDNRMELNAWKRIATFFHKDQISKRRISEIFWHQTLGIDFSQSSEWNSLFNEMAARLDQMGIAVNDYRPKYIKPLTD